MTEIHVSELERTATRTQWSANLTGDDRSRGIIGVTMLDTVEALIRRYGPISQCKIIVSRPEYPWGKDWNEKPAARFHTRRPGMPARKR